jgi:VanZ family protein
MKKIIDVVLLLCWLGLIFYLSSQTGESSGGLSSGIMDFLIASIQSIFKTIEINKEFVHTLIRKSAHFSAYAVLGILAYRVFVTQKRVDKKQVFYLLIFCILYAISDEVHQAFVPGRGPAAFDVFIDTLGSVTGIYLVTKVHKFRANRNVKVS